MKSLKKIILFAFIIISTNTLKAQRFGIIGGLNYANMSISEFQSTSSATEESVNKSIFGHNIGIIIDIPFSEQLSLQPSLLYATKGNKFEFSSSDNTFGFNSYEISNIIKLSYIEMPVNLKLSFSVGKIKVFGAFGPYVAWGISGSNKGESSFNFNGEISKSNFEVDIQWGNSSLDFLRRLDYGLGYGLGVEINSFQIGASYNQGLANIRPSTESNGFRQSIKNNVIRLSVAYFIGKEKIK